MKKVKKIMFILLSFIGVFTIKINVLNASNNQYIATDSNIFKENALIANSQEDQSEKLEKCLHKAALDGKELYIPAGQYYINKSISLNKSNIYIMGDQNGATILKNINHMTKEDEKNVLLDASAYNKKENLKIENLFLEGIAIRLRNTSNVKIENNIFYNPSSKFVLYIEDGKEFNINHNIFLRDLNHTVLGGDRSRTIYVGGYYYSSNSYKWIENVYIKDNIIGAKINELDAIKSLQKAENQKNVNRLQKAIADKKIELANDQNYITTGINSFGMLKTAYIENNLFYSFWEDNLKQSEKPISNDHATYLRGSQNVYMSGNHVRGFHNGPAGGIKFKSGRNIVVVNNYLRNTGIILSNHPEYGYGESFDDGSISEFTNMLIANNTFDFKKWQEYYGIGINYEVDNLQGLPTNIKNNVFIKNKYINYHNIPQNKRVGFGLPNLFLPQSTYIKNNLRDDTPDGILTIQNINSIYNGKFDELMIKDWRLLLSQNKKLEEYYNQKKKEAIPFLNTLAIAVPTTIELGQKVLAENLVTNVYDKDNQKPILTIVNPKELEQIGKKEIVVKIKYLDQLPEVNITVPVTIKDTTKPQIKLKKTDFERGEKIEITDIISFFDMDKNLNIECEPQIDPMKLGSQLIKVSITDSSQNIIEQEIKILIKKSRLQQEIESLFDTDGNIKEYITIDKIKFYENQVNQLENKLLKNEFKYLLDIAKQQIKNDVKNENKNDIPNDNINDNINKDNNINNENEQNTDGNFNNDSNSSEKIEDETEEREDILDNEDKASNDISSDNDVKENNENINISNIFWLEKLLYFIIIVLAIAIIVVIKKQF